MHRITSQLCEVFDCTDQELKESGLLEQFDAWLQRHPEVTVSYSLETGEETNHQIAMNFKKSLLV